MSLRSRAWAAIGGQLRHPSGLAGGLIGRLMGVVNRQSNRIAIGALEIRPGDTILELGVGPGIAVATLAGLAQQGRVVGIDHSPTMLAQAARRNRRAIAGRGVHLLLGRFAALPFATESVDRILAVHVAYFIGADASEIREARRVLRPGGRVAIFATDKSTMASWGFTRSGHHRLFDRDEIAGLLSTGGFATDEIAVAEVSLPFGIAGLLAVATKRA
jgi:ubiquinone/menaquinone biosynthesis C-methylase UbiE